VGIDVFGAFSGRDICAIIPLSTAQPAYTGRLKELSMKTLSLITVLAFTSSLAFAADESAPAGSALSALAAVSGVWLTEAGDAEIEIADCGDGTPCGVMVRVQTEDGSPAIDTNNPDPDLKSRPLVGTKMMWGFREKSGRWKSGQIYNAENGKTYKSKIKRLEDGTLEVKGCIGPICQGQIWTKIIASED
jgi:uncharacterized protein (DUF2147 family)